MVNKHLVSRVTTSNNFKIQIVAFNTKTKELSKIAAKEHNKVWLMKSNNKEILYFYLILYL